MKISRDPNSEHYVGNFAGWRVTLDGQKQDIFELIDADEAGSLTFIARDEEGNIEYEADKPKTVAVTGAVTLSGRMPTCTGCAKRTQERRKQQRWWLL